MNLLLALLPLIVTAVLLVGLQRSALQAGLATLLVAIAVSLLVPAFQLTPDQLLLALGRGGSTALVVLLVLLPSLFLYHLLRASGGIDVLARAIAQLSADRDLQVLLLVLGLAPFVESVSGFGVATVVVVPLLIALRVNVFRAAILGTLGQMSVPWGALAVGTTLGAQLTGLDANLLSARTALLTAPLPLLYGLVALGMSGGWPALRRCWGAALLGGVLLALGHYFFSWIPGVELAGVLASLLTLLALMLWGRLVTPLAASAAANPAPAANDSPALALPLWKALAPYTILTLLLLLSRVIAPLRLWLQQQAVLHLPALDLHLPLLYTPGFSIIVAILVALPILGREGVRLREVVQRTQRQFLPAALAIVSFLATAQVLAASQMITEVAAVGIAFGSSYGWIAPWIGALGGWITGSNVGSNALFAPLQQVAGNSANLPLDWVMGAQNGAGSHATMIAPTRIILTTTAAGLVGAEGRLLRSIGPLVVAAVAVITLLFVWVSA